MKKEKKLKPTQKIALERIYRLVELAKKTESKDNTCSKKYLSLVKRLSEKYNVKIPLQLKQTYCKKCSSMNLTQKKSPPFLVTKCEECGFEKKYSLKEEKQEN